MATKASFDVLIAQPNYDIGTFSVTASGVGLVLREPARRLAAEKLGIDMDNISISKVLIRGGELTTATAAATAVKQLRQWKAAVVVAARVDTPAIFEGRLAESEATVSRHEESIARLDGKVQRLIRRQDRLAMLALMEAGRTKMMGHALEQHERGDFWNGWLDDLSNDQLAALGLTRELANLTRFGKGSIQYQAVDVAHSFTRMEIAEAVTTRTQPSRSFFAWLYSVDPEAMVMEEEDDDV